MFSLFAKKPVVLAHDSKFHADDIFAVAALSMLLGEVTVVRSRDPQKIAAADYVVDVGGVYDPAAKRFDHHQTGGAGKRDNGIPYAAIGLVWKEYGVKLCDNSPSVARLVDEKLVMPIDAHDNGFNVYSLGETEVEPYTIQRLFQSTLPTWKEDMADSDPTGEKKRLELFLENVELAKKVLQREIARAKDKVEANALVEAAFRKAKDPRLLILDKSYPWGDVAESHPEILFVIIPKSETDWRIQGVQKEKGNFANRKNLPAAWAGKQGAELEQVAGVPGAKFCHNALFMAAADSEAAIMQLADIALKS